MRENRTYGLTRGRSGEAASLYSTGSLWGMFNEVCQELKNIDDTLVLFPA